MAEYLTTNQKTCVRLANSLPFLNRRKYAKFLVSSCFFKESSKRNKWSGCILENFKDNFEKIDPERSIKSVEETLKTYLKVIKRLKN